MKNVNLRSFQTTLNDTWQSSHRIEWITLRCIEFLPAEVRKAGEVPHALFKVPGSELTVWKTRDGLRV